MPTHAHTHSQRIPTDTLVDIGYTHMPTHIHTHRHRIHIQPCPLTHIHTRRQRYTHTCPLTHILFSITFQTLKIQNSKMRFDTHTQTPFSLQTGSLP